MRNPEQQDANTSSGGAAQPRRAHALCRSPPQQSISMSKSSLVLKRQIFNDTQPQKSRKNEVLLFLTFRYNPNNMTGRQQGSSVSNEEKDSDSSDFETSSNSFRYSMKSERSPEKAEQIQDQSWLSSRDSKTPEDEEKRRGIEEEREAMDEQKQDILEHLMAQFYLLNLFDHRTHKREQRTSQIDCYQFPRSPRATVGPSSTVETKTQGNSHLPKIREEAVQVKRILNEPSSSLKHKTRLLNKPPKQETQSFQPVQKPSTQMQPQYSKKSRRALRISGSSMKSASLNLGGGSTHGKTPALQHTRPDPDIYSQENATTSQHLPSDIALASPLIISSTTLSGASYPLNHVLQNDSSSFRMPTGYDTALTKSTTARQHHQLQPPIMPMKSVGPSKTFQAAEACLSPSLEDFDFDKDLDECEIEEEVDRSRISKAVNECEIEEEVDGCKIGEIIHECAVDDEHFPSNYNDSDLKIVVQASLPAESNFGQQVEPSSESFLDRFYQKRRVEQSEAKQCASTEETRQRNDGHKKSNKKIKAGQMKMGMVSDLLQQDSLPEPKSWGNPRLRRAQQKKLACPFFKRSPQKYANGQACTGPGWETAHRVK